MKKYAVNFLCHRHHNARWCFAQVIYVCVIFMSLCLSACHNTSSAQTISIMTYNTQTFFDAHESGNEFAEFRGGKSPWNAARYETRLKRLCEVLESANADIVVLQEIEQKGILRDIANHNTRYRYAVFLGEQEDSFGCALLSRYPIESVQNHTLTLGLKKEPSLRAVSHISLDMSTHLLSIFVCHWKSKSSGANSSRMWRIAQEMLLSYHMTQSHEIVIAAGDFNQTHAEFTLLAQNPALYNPWQDYETIFSHEFSMPPPHGSYVYKNTWEDIDHFWIKQAHTQEDTGEQNRKTTITIKGFRPHTQGAHVDAEQKPLRYNVFSGSGYSDHLPLIVSYSVLPLIQRQEPLEEQTYLPQKPPVQQSMQ